MVFLLPRAPLLGLPASVLPLELVAGALLPWRGSLRGAPARAGLRRGSLLGRFLARKVARRGLLSTLLEMPLRDFPETAARLAEDFPG
ncbi:MAG: hypothetical protein AB1486_04320 [Planctomycetota bacterium]